MKKNLLAVVIFISVSAHATSQTIVFENLGIHLSLKDSLKIDRMIRLQADFYKQLGFVDSIHIKLRLFPNREEYLLYLTKDGSDDALSLSGGLYQGRTKELLVPKTLTYLPVVYHEMSHYFFCIVIRKSPGWLNEGLAKYFEYSKIAKNNVTYKLNVPDARFIKSMLALKEINLKDILSIEGKEVAKKSLTNEGFIHKVGYGIVYLLLQKQPDSFVEMMLKIKNGLSSYDAIQETYSGGFDRFEKDFVIFYH
jgi:hypothetical protein